MQSVMDCQPANELSQQTLGLLPKIIKEAFVG